MFGVPWPRTKKKRGLPPLFFSHRTGHVPEYDVFVFCQDFFTTVEPIELFVDVGERALFLGRLSRSDEAAPFREEGVKQDGRVRVVDVRAVKSFGHVLDFKSESHDRFLSRAVGGLAASLVSGLIIPQTPPLVNEISVTNF